MRLVLHDEAGRVFDSNEGVSISHDMDLPSVARVRLQPDSGSLELTGLAEGRAVLELVAASRNGAPVSNFLVMSIESGLAPGMLGRGRGKGEEWGGRG